MNHLLPPLRALAFLLLAAGSLRAADAALDIEVDARELPRRLLHTRLTVPCRPGTLRLWYPKWIPGTHGPYGKVEDVGGLRVETADGKPLRWRRDEVELHCVACDVPDGVRQVRVRLDTICNQAATMAAGCYSFGNASVGVLNWNTCLLYPEGTPCADLPVRLRLRLPPKWRYATALKADGEKDGVVTFRTVSLEELVDCPLIAGEHLRSIPLDSGDGPPAFLHVASESPTALQVEPKVIDCFGRVVREAVALFGRAHYPEYHFLVTCSDELGYFGLEHHACSINGVRERDLADAKRLRGWVANLLPHEYAHSWCGKFRRPAGMCTPDFHTPQKTRLLWVYEGLTTYLGDLLMVRSGLVDANEYREMLAETVGNLMRREGRRWRPLEDTAVANHLLRSPSGSWNELRRGQDFYEEGMLLWLDADAVLRERSQGRHRLDDFCKRFMGPVAAQGRVVPYEQADVVKLLRGLADFDWEPFIERRVAAPQEALPLDVVGRIGYRLQYATKPSGYLDYLQRESRGRGFVTARDSLGLTFSADGRIADVVPGMAGDRAGLAPAMQVVGVNGRKFSAERLHDALADSVASRKIELLLLQGDRFRTVAVEYADGPKYLELVRDASKPDVLADILAPKAGKAK